MNSGVAITGVGAVTPLGVGADALIDGWIGGRCGLADGVGACRTFDPRETMSVKEARRVARFAQLGFAAAAEAIEQAGWTDIGLPTHGVRVGCVAGVGLGGGPLHEQQQDALREHGPGRISPLLVPAVMPTALSAVISQRYGLRGYSTAVCSACASGADAIALAARMIDGGLLEAAVVAGAESTRSPLVEAAFTSMGATSTLGVSRPFDRRRDGFVLSEGAGALVLEAPSLATTRSATVIGWVRGVGLSADAHHVTVPDPTGEHAARAMSAALTSAGAAPADVAYVNAHGTSTPLNDPIETAVIKRALGPAAADVPISSTKSAIGHTLGGAGAVDAVATVLALDRGVAPPTLGLEEPDPECDLDYVPGKARRLRRRDDAPLLALSNAFGFGGHNVVLALERGTPPSP